MHSFATFKGQEIWHIYPKPKRSNAKPANRISKIKAGACLVD